MMFKKLLDFLKLLFVEQKRVRGFEFVHVKSSEAQTLFFKLPTRKTKGSACYDFYLPCDVTVPAHGYSKIIPTNVKAYMPADEVLMLHIRSSVGILKHVTLANCTGIIDSDYYNNSKNEGNIGLTLHNDSDEDVAFYCGECIMQGMFVKYCVTDNDHCTGERNGGIGSTGK